MKKIIPRLLSVIVSLIFPILIFAETSNLITQLKVIDNDTTFRYLYYYDANNNKSLETKYFLNENIWNKLTQTEWIYNNNKCEIQRERVFRSNDWHNVYEINYTYEDDLLISETHFKFVNGMAEQQKMVIFTYENSKLKTKKDFFSVNNQLILKQVVENNYENDTLKSTSIKKISSVPSEMEEYKSSFDYNTSGMLLSKITEVKTPENEWLNVEKVNWYYNSSTNKLLSLRTKKWDAVINKWENSSMINYEYSTTNEKVVETYYRWSSMFWERNTKYTYEYDSNGSLLNTTLMLPIFRQWRTVSTINYSDFINDKANKMETVLSFWGGNTGDKISAEIPFRFNSDMEIKKGNQIIISYEKVDNTDISTYSMTNDLLINVYPNPSEDYFYFNPEKYKVNSWAVYDLNGQMVIQHGNEIRTGVIDMANAPKGIYLLKVYTSDKVMTQKLIKK